MAIPDYLKKTIVVFDVETAQLGDHVIEIGFSIFKNAELHTESGVLVRPQILIEKEASNVHNIYWEDVEDAPEFKDVAMWCYNMLNTADIHCAYNYDYDRDVLEKEFARVGIKFPVKPMVDPFIFFKKYHKYNRGKKLTDAAEVYGVNLVGSHRAVNDTTATGNVLFKMAATKTDFPKTVDKLIASQRKLIEDQFVDFYNYMHRMNRDLPTPPNYSYYEV